MKKLLARLGVFSFLIPLAVVVFAVAAYANVQGTPYKGSVSFTVTCTTSLTPIPAIGSAPNAYQAALNLFGGRPYKRLRCANNSATAVFFGGAGLAAAAPHNCIANTGCAGADFEETVGPGQIGCMVAAATTDIGCLAQE